MKNLLAALVLSVFVAGPVSAQPPMHVTVEPTRVKIGAIEFLNRCAVGMGNLVIPAGNTFEHRGDRTYGCIEVAGRLAFPRTGDHTLRFQHLIILPGGVLDAGTQNDPLRGRVRFIVRDLPIDLTADPFQWGNGIVNFGTRTMVGRSVARTWTVLTADAETGARTIRLDVPAGWLPGDFLFLPDMHASNYTTRVESDVWIESINAARTAITLSKPLDFEHRSILRPDASRVAWPRIANLTSNVSVESENPNGTKGHTVDLGHEVTSDIRYVQFVAMGRTKAEDLRNTTVDTGGSVITVGTNQIGKYALHAHHTAGFRTTYLGNRFIGTPGAKWSGGAVIHATHFATIEDNVGIRSPGGCYVTEDGYETQNVFRRNVCALSFGNGLTAVENLDPKLGHNCPGCEGSGFWFRALHQVIDENEAWNNIIGINLFNQNHVGVPTVVPSKPGSIHDTPWDPTHDRAALYGPVSMRGNVTIANLLTGLEGWAQPDFPVLHHLSANNWEKQYFAGQSTGIFFDFRNAIFICPGRGDGVSSSSAYVWNGRVEDSEVRGCERGFQRGVAMNRFDIKNSVLQNVLNIDYPGLGSAPQNGTLIENVRYEPLNGRPIQAVNFGNGYVWPGFPTPLPDTGISMWLKHRGAIHQVINWNGTDQDFYLFSPQQAGTTLAWPEYSNGGWFKFYVPEDGLTMLQAWRKYGLAHGGAVAATMVPVEGLVNAVAGVPEPLGQLRCVVSAPNMLAPAVVRADGMIRLHQVVTGDQSAFSGLCEVSVDGGPISLHWNQGGDGPDSYPADIAVITPGTHTITTKPAGAPESSRMTFRYFVGAPSGEPQPKPVDCVLSAEFDTLVSETPFGMCVGGFKSQTQVWSKSIVTPAQNGGQCMVPTETRTVSEPCQTSPPLVTPTFLTLDGGQILICTGVGSDRKCSAPIALLPFPVN